MGGGGYSGPQDFSVSPSPQSPILFPPKVVYFRAQAPLPTITLEVLEVDFWDRMINSFCWHFSKWWSTLHPLPLSLRTRMSASWNDPLIEKKNCWDEEPNIAKLFIKLYCWRRIKIMSGSDTEIISQNEKEPSIEIFCSLQMCPSQHRSDVQSSEHGGPDHPERGPVSAAHQVSR